MTDTIASGYAPMLADLDGDGDLDAAVRYYQVPDKIFWNNGSGLWMERSQDIPQDAAWGDLDGDGDVDAFMATAGQGYQTTLNDGTGHFSSYWSLEDQALTNMLPTLIDMDNDGDLDALVTYRLRAAVHPAKIFFNDGLGRFTDSGQALGSFLAGRAAFGDLNSDGYPDLLLTSFEKAGEIWLNDGTGHFKDTSYRLQGQGAFHSPSLKDLDNDGDLDIVIANYFGGRNEIWFNESH